MVDYTIIYWIGWHSPVVLVGWKHGSEGFLIFQTNKDRTINIFQLQILIVTSEKLQESLIVNINFTVWIFFITVGIILQLKIDDISTYVNTSLLLVGAKYYQIVYST